LLVESEKQAIRYGARKAHIGRVLRSLFAHIPASETENDRTQSAHRPPHQIGLAHRQAHSSCEDQAVACRSLACPIRLRARLAQSLHRRNQTHFRNGDPRRRHLAISSHSSSKIETCETDSANSEL